MREREGGGDKDRGERGGGRGGRGGGAGGPRRTRRKVDPFLVDKNLKIDWRDAQLLSRFITERGRIVPRRVSGVTAKNQRKLAVAIKKARQMGLIPFGGHKTSLRYLV